MMLQIEQNKALVRRLYEEAVNRGNLALIDDLFSSDFIDHSTPEQAVGPSGVKQYFIQVRIGFPDLHVTIDDLLAEGEKVVVRTTWYGTQQGIYEGVTATGKQVSRTMIQIFLIQDSKITEEWNEGDSLSV